MIRGGLDRSLIVQKYHNKGDVINHCAVLGPPVVHRVQQFVAAQLYLVLLVEGRQQVYHFNVLHELPHPV